MFLVSLCSILFPSSFIKSAVFQNLCWLHVYEHSSDFILTVEVDKRELISRSHTTHSLVDWLIDWLIGWLTDKRRTHFWKIFIHLPLLLSYKLKTISHRGKAHSKTGGRNKTITLKRENTSIFAYAGGSVTGCPYAYGSPTTPSILLPMGAEEEESHTYKNQRRKQFMDRIRIRQPKNFFFACS